MLSGLKEFLTFLFLSIIELVQARVSERVRAGERWWCSILPLLPLSRPWDLGHSRLSVSGRPARDSNHRYHMGSGFF